MVMRVDDRTMGRKPLPKGTRQKDLKAIIIKPPKEIYEEIEKQGNPNNVVLELVISKFGKK